MVKSGNSNIKNEEIKNSKVKSHIIQRIKYKKIIPKRHSGEEREKNPRINCAFNSFIFASFLSNFLLFAVSIYIA